MWLAIAIPTSPPEIVVRIPDIVSFRVFHMAIAKRQVGAIAVPVGRTLRMTRAGVRGIHIGIVTDKRGIFDGGDVTVSDHVGRLKNLRILHWSLGQSPINVSAQTQLGVRNQVEPPVVNAVGKPRSVPDTVSI